MWIAHLEDSATLFVGFADRFSGAKVIDIERPPHVSMRGSFVLHIFPLTFFPANVFPFTEKANVSALM